jgi:hypothetical protein
MAVVTDAPLNTSALSCVEVVRLAMMRLRLLRAGETPQGNELEDGLRALQGMYDLWCSTGLFGRLNDVIPTSDYTASEQDRVNNDGGYTITLPLTYSNQTQGTYYPTWPDERTWSALQVTINRPPRDLSCIEVVEDGASARYLYDAHARAWLPISALEAAGNAPLSDRGVTGFVSCLAQKLADEYGAQTSPGVEREASLFKWGLSSRYGSTRVAAMQDYF